MDRVSGDMTGRNGEPLADEDRRPDEARHGGDRPQQDRRGPPRQDRDGRDDKDQASARDGSGSRDPGGKDPDRKDPDRKNPDRKDPDGRKGDDGAGRSVSGSLSGPFIRHPVATTLLMLGVLLVGIAAYPFLPVAPLPQVDFPTIQVTARLPGASPDTMASSVAQPLETQFAQVPGVSEMTSTSTLGTVNITIQFDLSRDVDEAANDVQAAINAAGGQLPQDLPSPPTYRKVNPADSPILIMGAYSDTMPLTEVDDAIETKLAQQVSQVTGVGQVLVGGQQKPAVRVQVDPAKLLAKGLTLEDVRTKLAGATVNQAKGNLDGPSRSYTIYANDQLTEASKWNDVVISYSNNGPLRVSDIGKAVQGPEDSKQAAWTDGKRGVFLVIFKQPNANVIQTVDSVTKELPKLLEALPPAIHVYTLSDRTQTIRASVRDVQVTLLITIGLVVAVIFVFLRNLRSTIIPSVTVPLALLGTCGLMWVAGYTLDNLSLMALTISVGFVVDDAIVMLENITRYIEGGMKPYRAALKGAGEIGFTILSISLSLIAVLIPLLLMPGIIGRLFREFAVTLSMTIVVSAVVALTLTPMLASRFLKSEKETRHGKLYQWSEKGFEALVNGYGHMLDVVMRFRFITLMVFFASVAATVVLFMMIPKGFFPQQDTGLIQVTTEAGQDVSFARMRDYQEKLGAIIQKDPAVDHVAMNIGGNGGNALNTGRMYVTLKPLENRDARADAIIARLRPKLNEVQGARAFLQAAQDVRVGGRQSRTQYQYTLQDSEIGELNQWAPKMLAKLKTLPELTDVASDQQTAGTTLTLTIDRDQASRYGIQADAIDQTLYDAFGQRQVAQYFTQLNSYHVVLEVTPGLQGDDSTLGKLYVKSSAGSLVPLSAFSHWTTVPVQPLSISHQSQFPSITISFNLKPGGSLGTATEAINKAAQEIGLPPTVSTQFSGTAQAFQQSLGAIPLLIVAALVVVYLILGVLYESFIHPLTILSTLPSAGVGALATLMLFGYDFTLIALIGLILLIGIVKKNGIMLVDFAIEAEREQGLSSEEAIKQAALLRFRPIMMTTAAALLGGVPLMLGHGSGSEVRQPLGFAMVGGLLVSQALTLFTTPVIYLYLDQLSEWLASWRKGKSPEEEAEEDDEEQDDEEKDNEGEQRAEAPQRAEPQHA